MNERLFDKFSKWSQKRAGWFYTALIKPRQLETTTRNREIVLYALLTGTFVAFLSLTLLLLIGYAYSGDSSVIVNIGLAFGACIFTAVTYFIARRQAYTTAAGVLVGMYILLAMILLLRWGSSLPFALVMLCLVIVLAGILLGSRYGLVASAGSVVVLLGVELLDMLGIYSPDETWLTVSAGFGEVIGYSIIFLVIGVVSWLFGRQTERSLARAQAAEAALLKEQAQLETKIKERTLELQVVQFEEMQQLHRFAEIGQLSTALLHELANHLAILTLDLEDIQQQQRSRSLNRARQSILYLDSMVERVREQLQDTTDVKPFNIAAKLSEVIRLLRSRASEIGVSIEWAAPRERRLYKYIGDSVKLNQILAIVINNAIESYEGVDKKQPIRIQLYIKKGNVIVTVKDFGYGIDETRRKRLFEPFVSTKKKGMGMGLFIAKRMLEKYFQGTIRLEPSRSHTQFTISFPIKPK